MKNFMVANLPTNKKKYDFEKIVTLAKAQIENSLDIGWNPDDIILLTNFPLAFMNIIGTEINFNKFCWTGSKMFGIRHLFKEVKATDTIWAHDLDAWQNAPFECPHLKDAGAACYSKPKYNGGSVFWRPTAIDIIDEILKRIEKNKEKKEEPTLNAVFKSKEYEDRITTLNYTYNVGCSGYYERFTKSIKPIKVVHFHPYNRIAWETHALDRNGIGEKGISNRLETLIRKYYPEIATELSDEGKKRRGEKIEERKKKNK